MAVMKRQLRDEADLPLEESGSRAAALMLESFTRPNWPKDWQAGQNAGPQFPPHPA